MIVIIIIIHVIFYDTFSLNRGKQNEYKRRNKNNFFLLFFFENLFFNLFIFKSLVISV